MKFILKIFLLTILVLPQAYAQPNILLIIADDLGVDYSSGYQDNNLKPTTPNLDALKTNGLTFKNAWAAPVCTPTRASIMSGKYGSKTGVTAVGDILTTDHTSLFTQIDDITDNKYTKALIGKWHLSDRQDLDAPADHGVDYYSGIFGGGVQDYFNWTKTTNGVQTNSTTYTTTELTTEAIDWINGQNSSWMMWLAYNAAHTPFHEPPADLYSIDNTNGNRRKYAAMIEAMDTEIGRLLDNIPEDELQNTIIIYVGDNGTPGQVVQNYPDGHAKGSVYQGGVHVPLIISGAGVTRINQSENALVHVVDIHATLMEVVGAELPGGIYNSLSFDHLLTNEPGDIRKYNYSEGEMNGFRWCIRDAQYKLIQLSDGTLEFYDLIADSLELNNIIGQLSAEQEEIRSQLATEVEVIQNDWSCQDFIQNGDEMDIDCGGSLCAPCALSVADLSAMKVQIFPNPVSEELSIHTEELPIENLKVYNSEGKTLYKASNLNSRSYILDVSTFSSGHLFLEIESNGKKVVQKFIKE